MFKRGSERTAEEYVCIGGNMIEKCVVCGGTNNLKRGWTNSWYCSESCERSGVSSLHRSMPGAGPLPKPNWVPDHIGREIQRRWES